MWCHPSTITGTPPSCFVDTEWNVNSLGIRSLVDLREGGHFGLSLGKSVLHISMCSPCREVRQIRCVIYWIGERWHCCHGSMKNCSTNEHACWEINCAVKSYEQFGAVEYNLTSNLSDGCHTSSRLALFVWVCSHFFKGVSQITMRKGKTSIHRQHFTTPHFYIATMPTRY